MQTLGSGGKQWNKHVVVITIPWTNTFLDYTIIVKKFSSHRFGEGERGKQSIKFETKMFPGGIIQVQQWKMTIRSSVFVNDNQILDLQFYLFLVFFGIFKPILSLIYLEFFFIFGRFPYSTLKCYLNHNQLFI